MGKIVRLTESDLVRLVKKVILEQEGGNPLSYSVVVDVPNTNKEILYNKIKGWMAETYNNFSKVIQLDDKDIGAMVIKANMNYKAPSMLLNCWDGYVDYTLKVQIKDNKYKIEMKDFTHKAGHPSSPPVCSLGTLTDKEIYSDKGLNKGSQNKIWNAVKSETKTYFDMLSQSLNKSIESGIKDDFEP